MLGETLWVETGGHKPVQGDFDPPKEFKSVKATRGSARCADASGIAPPVNDGLTILGSHLEGSVFAQSSTPVSREAPRVSKDPK